MIDQSNAEYAGVRETAKRLGISVSYLNKSRISGGGPAFIKVGSAVRYHWPTVEAWLRSRSFQSNSEAKAA